MRARVTHLASGIRGGLVLASLALFSIFPVFGPGVAAEILFWPARLDSYSGY